MCLKLRDDFNYQRHYLFVVPISSRRLIISAFGITVFNSIVNSNFMNISALMLGVLGYSLIGCKDRLNGLFSKTRFYKIGKIVIAILGALIVLNAFGTPAQAQFYQNAETWMTGQFGGAGEAIPLVFNVLRGLFLIYLGISLVKVVQAARENEDWQNLARTPMIILIAMTVGDILANVITGGGTNAGGGNAGG